MEPCHECWKVKQNQGNDGSICQFEGFRKVQRIRSDFQTPFAFEGAGYLDPYVDPSKADLNLWTTPSRTDLGTVLNKISMITIFGRKLLKQNFVIKFDIF